MTFFLQQNILFVLVSFSWICFVCSETCSYLDRFQKVRYKTCYSGCCGDVHISYCCIVKHFEVIVLGSVVGFFFLAVFVALVIFYCLVRRCRISAPDTEILIDPSDRPNYGATVNTEGSERTEVIVAPVVIDVTPASPEDHDRVEIEHSGTVDTEEDLTEVAVETDTVVDDAGIVNEETETETNIEETVTTIEETEEVVQETDIIVAETEEVGGEIETIVDDATTPTETVVSDETKETGNREGIEEEIVDTIGQGVDSVHFDPDINTDLSIDFSTLAATQTGGVITTDLDAEDSDSLDTTVTQEDEEVTTVPEETVIDETIVEEEVEAIEVD